MNDYHCSGSLFKVFFLDYLLPFTAIIVSICALIFSVIYNRKTYSLTKEHNKKTVEPKLSELYTVDLRHADKEPAFQSLQIKNSGFGPGVIKSLTFTVNDKPYKEIKTLIKENLLNLDYNIKLSSTSSLEGYVIGPNEQLTIFKLYFDNTPANDSFLKFRELATKISLRIEYESVYNEISYLNTEHLQDF